MNEIVNFLDSKVKQSFLERVEESPVKLTWKQEAFFAYQIIQENDCLQRIVNQNRNSFRDAVLQVATLGITLNPACKLAYLVPRKNKICLDISYTGLIHIAVREGRIRHVVADVVREGDTFVYNGKYDKPVHQCDPFAKDYSKRPIIGAYCLATLPDGAIAVETMDRAELDKIRKVSPSASRADSVWNNWESEKCKISVIKRAYKTWPRGTSDILDKTVYYIDQLDVGTTKSRAAFANELLTENTTLEKVTNE